MKRIFSLLSRSAILVFECGKDENPVDQGNESGYYMPLTIGSTWTYESTADGVMKEITHTIYKDTVIKGKTYVLTSVSNGGMAPRRRSGDTIYTPSATGETAVILEGPIGASWGDTTVYDKVSSIWKYTIPEKISSRIVLNKEYKSILRMNQKNYIVENGNVRDSSESNVFFARNVGIIDFESLDGSLKLKSYNVK